MDIVDDIQVLILALSQMSASLTNCRKYLYAVSLNVHLPIESREAAASLCRSLDTIDIVLDQKMWIDVVKCITAVVLSVDEAATSKIRTQSEMPIETRITELKERLEKETENERNRGAIQSGTKSSGSGGDPSLN